MTEPIEQPEPEQLEPDDDDEQVLDIAAVRKIRREAAVLCKRVHELEEQVGAQAARESAHQLEAVEAAAKAARFIDPSDFLAVHPYPTPFLDEQFRTFSATASQEAARAVLEQKPHLAASRLHRPVSR